MLRSKIAITNLFSFYISTLTDTLFTLKAELIPQLSWEKTTRNKGQDIWLSKQYNSSPSDLRARNVCYVTSLLQLWVITAMSLILPAEGRFGAVC